MAAGSKGIKAGRAYVELGTDDSKMRAGFKKASNRLRRFSQSVGQIGSQMARVGAIAMAPLLGAAKVFSSLGDSVAKMAKRTGLSVEALSELRFVASQTGTSIEAFEIAIKRMQRTIYDAGRGLSTAVDGLADLGLSVADFAGLKPEQQFTLLADRIARIEDPTTKAALALTLFGRSGTELLPMMENGAKGIEKVRREARALDLTMSGKSAEAAEDFTDALDRVTQVAKRAAFEVGEALAPALEAAFGWFLKTIQGARNWIREHGGMIRTALKLSAAVLGLGVVLMGLSRIGIAVAASMKLVFAHPVILAITAAVVAITAAVVAFDKLQPKVARTVEEMARLRDVIKDMTLLDIEAQIAEIEKQMAAARKEIILIGKEWPLIPFWEVANRKKYIQIVQELAEGMELLWKRKRQLQAGTTELTMPGLGAERADEEWVRKIHQLQIGFIQDEYQQSLARIHAEYDYERQQALAIAATKATLDKIENARNLEIGLLDKQTRKKEDAERQRIRDADHARAIRIEELGLRGQFKGIRLEKELLKLKEREALISAAASGERLDLVRKEFDLKERLLGLSEDLGQRMEMHVVGTFNPNAIRGLESSNLAKRTAIGVEKISKTATDMLSFMRQGHGLVFS